MTERSGRLALLRHVIRDRRLHRLVASFGLYSVAEQATWLAITVHAFGRGGVEEAGVVAFVQLAPGIVLTPLLSTAGDRFRADIVLAVGYAVQAAAMLATAAAIATDQGPLLVYGAATVASVAVTLSRPTMGALLPAATPTPTHLAAARISLGVGDSIGALAGPAVAALLLALDDGPAVVFAVMGGVMLAATALVCRLGLPEAAVAAVDQAPAHVWRSTLAGVAALRADRSLRLIVAVTTLAGFVVGVCDVLFVSVADGLIDGSASTAGWFAAAFGLGALLGAVGAVSLALRARLVVPLAVSVAAAGLAVASLGAMSLAALVAVAFVGAGAGSSVAEIAGSTLAARFADGGVLARVYGVMEGLRVAVMAIGSLAVSAVAAWIGIRAGVIVLGLAAPALVALAAAGLRRVDRETPAHDPVLLRLLTADPIFTHLPPPALEQVVAAAGAQHVPTGADVIRQGQAGDAYYLVADGEVAVTVDGRPARTLDAGDGFGEIALVRDRPRTATVTALTPTTLYVVRRAEFLAALTGAPLAFTAADEHAQHHLDDDAGRSSPGLGPSKG